MESSDGLAVVGVVETGGPEDEKIIGPISIAQSISNKPSTIPHAICERVDQA